MAGNILITGGSGFIGTYLIKHLVTQGFKVINFDVSPPSLELQALIEDIKDDITYVKSSILDFPTFVSVVKEMNVQKIVHMAALFDPKESNRTPYITHQINIHGTLNVLEVAKIYQLKRVVYASSIAVYPEKLYEPMDEKHPVLVPGTGHGSHYGVSKATGELLGLTYWRNNGVSFVSTRFSGVFGYGMRYPMFIKDMIENALQDSPTTFRTGGKLCRDYTYVKDCVNAICCALAADEKKINRRIYLTASGEIYPASRVAEIVTELIPGAVIEIGSELTGFEKIDLAKRGKLDISSAKKELNYAPQFPIKEAILDYIHMFKKYAGNQTIGR